MKSPVGNAEVKSKRPFDVDSVRADFPILQESVHGKALVYLDNAATTQKPNCVIDAISDYYRHSNANVHRGAHYLSDLATAKFEQARDTVATFINSPSREQILWTRGTTEGVNLVAQCWGAVNLQKGDRILVAELEHHSNIVPWQLVAQKYGATLEAIPILDSGDIDLEALHARLDERVKLLSVAQVSNALGTINPLPEIIALAKSVGALTMVDGAQGVAHFPVDVQALGCDFYAFSGHKLFGPTGIGVLWGRRDLLEAMPPYQGGGEMIETVSFSGTRFNVLPYRFEAGTPDIAGAIGLAAAIDYLQSFDREHLLQHENSLLERCLMLVPEIEGLHRVGRPQHSASVFSFLVDGVHPADLGTLLDQDGIAVRTGHHCTQPLMQRLNIPGTARASFSIYNTQAEVDALFKSLRKALTLLR